MSHETGTTSSMNDFMSKLSTFVVANGGTEDQYTAEAGATDGKLSLHINSVYVHFAWNASQTPNIGVYQSLGFINAGTDIWAHTDDSGHGPPSTPSLTDGRWTSDFDEDRLISGIGSGPYTSYSFFHDDSTEVYFHCVLEYGPGTFRHFGFGEMEKFWDFTGGEYSYGHTQTSGSPVIQEALISSDGSITSFRSGRHASIHVEGLPGQPGTGKWGTTARFTSLGSGWVDRAGNFEVRMTGGISGGPLGHIFNSLPSNSGDGFLPLTPNAIFYRDVGPSPDNAYFMGWQPDVRSLNMKSLVPKEEFAVGDDTYIVFPHVRKQNLGVLEESENLGIAYKKIV